MRTEINTVFTAKIKVNVIDKVQIILCSVGKIRGVCRLYRNSA